jgi:hypothetical protein
MRLLTMLRILSMLFLTCLTVTAVYAEMVDIPADRDNTLIEDPDGALSNGMGPTIRAGRTNQAAFGIRRGLIRFDVAAVLPENARIDRVFLSLYQDSNNVAPSPVSLHRVLDDWGEGGSFTAGGGGAPAEPGDATWLHTFWPDQYWVQQGGLFIPHASATEVIVGKDFYTWQSTVHLVSDVRLWLRAPQRNFGWLVMGDEDTGGSAKKFDSREGDRPPVLTVEYHLQGE